MRRPRKKKKKRHSRTATWIGIGVLVAVLSGLATVFTLDRIKSGLPSLKKLENYRPITVSRFYSDDGTLIAELASERRILVSLHDIAPEAIEAFIAVEDKRFFQHGALDWRAIARAAVADILAGRVVEGGSTITQQVAKNLFLTQSRTLARKIKEALLALEIERHYSKQEILRVYLNQIYFGYGAYGIEEAARTYFGKTAKELTLAEAATLAALPRSPKRYSYFNNPRAARERRDLVLDRMVEAGFITRRQAAAAKQESFSLHAPVRVSNTAPYFVEEIRRYIEQKYGDQALSYDGLRVYTTLNLKMQEAAARAIHQGLKALGAEKIVARSRTGVPLQGALIAIDPVTGAIKAMVGGRNFRKSEYNRATQAERQPGSAFKPILYLTAMESGYTPDSMIDDSPVTYQIPGSGDWSPRNWNDTYQGPITLKTALSQSVNVVSVKLLNAIGPKKVVAMAHRLGITSPLNANLSLALGTSEVNDLELTSAFGVLADGGKRAVPYMIRKIVDQEGKVLEENEPKVVPVVDPEAAYEVTTMLEAAVQNGTTTRAQALGRPVAAKTGTTSDAADAWFVGFTPQLAAGVWVGYDDHSPLGEHVFAAGAAGPIWVEFMKQALAGVPALDFPVPPTPVPSPSPNGINGTSPAPSSPAPLPAPAPNPAPGPTPTPTAAPPPATAPG